MKSFRRKFLKISCLSFFMFPYSFSYSATKKIINQNLTDEQKKIIEEHEAFVKKLIQLFDRQCNGIECMVK